MKDFEQLLRNTEQRYSARSTTRAETEAKLREGRVLEADSAERVQKRLGRLAVDRFMVDRLQQGGVSFAPIPVGPSDRGDEITLERILGKSDLMGAVFLEEGYRRSRAVGRVHVRERRGRLVGYGTGFLVSPRLLLTNNHVLGTAEEAAVSHIEFNYQIGPDGKLAPSLLFAFTPADFFLTDPDLDYTLVAVQEALPGGQTLRELGWNRLLAEEGKIIIGEFVNIIQHPNGEPKQIALRQNQLIDVLDDWLHYETDTAPGSSGSPVFNDQWEVVGLHHSGVPRRDPQGNILTRDGRIWLPQMGEHRIDWIANEGARVSRIVAHLKNQPLSVGQERLLADMLEPDETTPIISAGVSPGEQFPQRLRIEAGAQNQDNVSVTIPLDITIRLGQMTSAPPAPQPVVVTAGPGETPPDLQDDLDALAKASTRPYYDEEADRQAREAYYADIDPEVDAQAFYGVLNALLTKTHVNQPRYKPRTHVYPWVDLQPSLKLRSVYSGILFDPEELIREDFRIGQARALRLSELFVREAALSPEALQDEIDLLEALLPYNCEHVVPQSWFDKREPMRGDIHHLFACEWGCNSFRGNQAYFDFADFEEVTRDDCGKREPNKFEPGNGKGAVARATLYFLLRYPGEINRKGGEFDLERLPILLAWHMAFPPDVYERHRNQAIFEVQGNRNPLIDFPEWVEKIDFTPGFGGP